MATTWKRSKNTDGDTIHTASTGYTVTATGPANHRRFIVRDTNGNKVTAGRFDLLREAKAYADEHATSTAAGTSAPAADRTPGLTVVTHPDGTTSTRKSKTMTYTHAVEIGPAPAARYAADLIRKADEQTAKAAKLRQAIKYNEVRIRHRGLDIKGKEDLYSYEARLTGSDVYSWCSREGLTSRLDSEGGGTEKVRDCLLRNAGRSAAYADEQAAKYRAEAAEILAKGEPVGKFYIYRWSTRADLAASCANGKEGSWYAARGHSVRVVTVDPN